MTRFGRARGVRSLVILASLLTGLSCVATNLPTIGSNGKPFQMEDDERQLWQEADRLEKWINRSKLIYKDPGLESYLEDIAIKLAPEGFRSQGIKPRIKILRDPYLNAFALPNGAIYLHTGILSRFENEAQLATLLGHELTHVTHRHTLRETRNAENKVTFIRTLQLLVAVAGAGFGLGLFVLGDDVDRLWALAAIRGYARELETEADEEGFRAIVRAGYDPREAPKVFEHLMEERDKEKVKEPFFFATHPKLQERLENYRRLLRTWSSSGHQQTERHVGAATFQDRVESLLLENAVMDLERGRFRTARMALERYLSRSSKNPRAHFLMGELHRRSGSEDANIESAIAAYSEAIRHDPDYGEPHRELGLLYRAQGRREQACAELQIYLRLCPNAPDAPIVKGYLKELESGRDRRDEP